MIVANRLPVRRDGHEWVASPGGLVAALLPVTIERQGAWVGWSGAPGSAPPPFQYEGADLRPIAISAKEQAAFYDGFANTTLWPLYHDAVRRPTYDDSWWEGYVAVNERYAQAVDDAAAPGATVWVHDYHLQLVPAMLRRRRPDLRIGFFLHIPFPPTELFLQLPWRSQVIEGLLGADVVGFQTPAGASNFASLARRLAGARGRGRTLLVDGRRVRAGAYPISIDTAAWEALATEPAVEKMAVGLRRELGSPRVVLLGVDRLDYTKGIDLRLRAFHELLSEGRLSTPDAVLVQIAVPSREEVGQYAKQRAAVEQLVGEINGQFGQVGSPAVHYLHRSLPINELCALYRASDVCLVTPLCDGMNLVAKEYVASRVDANGALVLSEFAGAARELTGAIQVNPHDLSAVKDAIMAAIALKPSEARARMQRMRRVVRRHDVHAWAAAFLGDLMGGATAPGS